MLKFELDRTAKKAKAGTKMVEERYYPIVRNWLEKEGCYCGGVIQDSKGKPFYFQNKGTKRLRIDVAGIKNHGTRSLDEIEVVAVEVRDVASVQYRDIQDAYAYSQYAHKCYLATTGSIKGEDKHEDQTASRPSNRQTD